MSKFKCECGHENPYGTLLCESCGKPLEQSDSNELLNMRYEGSARRSQTYKKTIVDKIWNFFSSVKVGIWIIVLILIASAIGTIFPQEMYIPPTVDPATHYEEQYGIFGQVYYVLGFHNLYGSWWFMLLLAALGISLIIASLDRFVPLYRSLKNQRVTRHESFMRRQRIYGISKSANLDESMEKAKTALIAKRYNVREENGNLLAEKGRFSRWGPYVNHVGLILFLIGAMLRFFPGMYIDEVLWIREGQQLAVPGTESYYLENKQFIFEVYDQNEGQFKDAIEGTESGIVPKNYQTDVTLYKQQGEKIAGAEPELDKVKDYSIRVNDPLKMDGYAVYQVDYKLNEFKEMSFTIEKKATGQQFGNTTIDLWNPEPAYDLGNGYKIEVMDYFPDFYFNEKEEPATQSKIPNNPAFIFKMFTPETPEGEVSFVAIRQNLEPLGENQYKMTFAGMDTANVSGLIVRKDRTLWILAIGAAIFMIGVTQGMYWNHRRIWLREINREIWISAHTNKNWFGVKKDLEYVTETAALEMPIDQVEKLEGKK
ncbi:cytochrome c biogenesis protein ResB [Bacillus taeanensis]|uniref:Cytochrome C biogenesis protein n=1 Tax=Bacillus taeanensis TaxID=273032 RepID=A0A366XVC6_9BACI|nr:cytochrome c biogenesis protein ResB [Bacillus taeanensis]RBW70340.1 cytochrome C biogenesis protein [Bacillus taeanensis]